jgi:glycosyltransferase involved in cell wall biosynthesis
MKPFSLIIPVYNEQDMLRCTTERLVDEADALHVPYEILLISNGSSDLSEAIGLELTRTFPQVRFFALPERGAGRAFKKGIDAARHEHLIFLDADLSSDLRFIREANSELENYCLVLGTKLKGRQKRPLFRKIASLAFLLSVRLMTGLKYMDYSIGAKAYRKTFLNKYKHHIDDHTSFVLNLAMIATIAHEPVIEIPIVCEDRRKSRFNLLHEAISKYKGLCLLVFKKFSGRF